MKRFFLYLPGQFCLLALERTLIQISASCASLDVNVEVGILIIGCMVLRRYRLFAQQEQEQEQELIGFPQYSNVN